MANPDNDNTQSRPSNRESENENLKPGSPPRPATEPKGSEGSARNSKTETDPATGAPQKDVSDSPEVPKT